MAQQQELDTKLTKAEAAYQSQPRGRSRCDGCAMFIAPDGCSAVQGSIAPEGWCRIYKSK